MFNDALRQLAWSHACLACKGEGGIAGKVALALVARAIELNVGYLPGGQHLLGLQHVQCLREQLSQLSFHCFRFPCL